MFIEHIVSCISYNDFVYIKSEVMKFALPRHFKLVSPYGTKCLILTHNNVGS